ncbi:radical SAM protein [Kitasatospora nipponensis]|uniref:Radical SAM protein n=1 Tax=Kitasatospora nipponensis TaxID=258049 RepID=A0ABN1VQ79_9ACTN
MLLAQPDNPHDLISGGDPTRVLDAVFVNAPLRDYALTPRTNDYTLPVLGLAYIATYAEQVAGMNVGVLDAEAYGLGVQEVAALLNQLQPRWVGFNLLAPTYDLSARIAAALDSSIRVMAGGHHAQAVPDLVLSDPRFSNLHALILGEGETRVAALLQDHQIRRELPGVQWRDRLLGTTGIGICDPRDNVRWMSPNISELPFVDRRFMPQDPYMTSGGRRRANIVGSRGCPYECGFCGAAASKNPNLIIRTRDPRNILAELYQLHDLHGCTAFRFVDDLFLGVRRVIEEHSAVFKAEKVGERFVWDATGRINILDRLPDTMLDTLRTNGLEEVALGVESGSARVLKTMDKRITPEMTIGVARRLMERGISVKSYFILGYPGERAEDLQATVDHIHRLWDLADSMPDASLRASVFEFRPYPGSPVWDRLLADGYDPAEMMRYGTVDLSGQGADEAMRGRDEFNFSVGIQFSASPLPVIRQHLADLSRQQYERTRQAGGRALEAVAV